MEKSLGSGEERRGKVANFMRTCAWRFLDAPCSKKGPFPKLIYKIETTYETEQFLMKDLYSCEFYWSILRC